MLGTIEEIIDDSVFVHLEIAIEKQANLLNLHVVFENGPIKIVGEIMNSTKEKLKINIVGELKNNMFIPGVSIKPSFQSTVRMITLEELEQILGKTTLEKGRVNFGYSNIYQNYPINISVNAFFSNHFAILGNSGAGKSFSVSRILQNLFCDPNNNPNGANIFLFDAYGEYTNALKDIEKTNPYVHYKTYTTNTDFADTEILKIPLWLLDVDDIALLLDVTTPNQLPIIEKALKLVPILSGTEEEVLPYKNDIIARALEDILLSGHQSTKIRDQVIAVLTKFNTKDLNLESLIVQPGYTRTLKQCLYIDKMGKLQEMELVVSFVKQFILDTQTEDMKIEKMIPYGLKELETAMDFALISEGILKSDKVYDEANVLSVRLHTLANSKEHGYFDVNNYITRDGFIRSLLTTYDGQKAQMVNFNINYVNDRLAKVIVKIISKMLFQEAVENQNRGSIPYHIVIEEAHRYVQKDRDTEILGYNIFDRITKEGRKYGVLLGLITQRPSELSDTSISQCSNFLILRTLHPKDLEYIKEMVPNVSNEITAQIKNLKPGNCIAFGNAFAIPIQMHFIPPNPTPLSNNVDINQIWYQQEQTTN